MLKNVLRIALRNFKKDKTVTAINVIGLTIGITCSLFLLMYILDELSYDRYHKNANHIYRIVSTITEPDNSFTWAVAQIPLAEELGNNYPEVKNAVRFFAIGKGKYKNGDRQFQEGEFFLADSNVFKMFSYEFIHGDPETALDNPFSIVVTEKVAIKYFGSTETAFTRSLQNKQGEQFKITGVIKDVPINSHFRFAALISRSTMPGYNGDWGNFGVLTYIQLPEVYDTKKMQISLDKIIKEKVNPIFEPMNVKIKYEMQKIVDIHLYSKIQDEVEAGGDISYIYIFGTIATFILVIASINYMNLATSRSVNRAKEVGIRKVLGSRRRQLIAQFLSESVIITLIALGFSLLLIYALLPAFNSLSNKGLAFSYVLQGPVIFNLIGVVLFVGIIGGSYPAFYLSSFNPVNVLRGKLATKGGSLFFRKALVVTQFAVSIFMLVCTLIVFHQLYFLRNKDLGFDKERVLRLELNEQELLRKSEVLVNRLKQIKDVASVGMAGSSPGQGVAKLVLKVEDNEGKLLERGVDLYSADYDFVKTMGMKIVEGREFSRDDSSDSLFAVLVNESMVKRMAWKDPIGKKFIFQRGSNPDLEKRVVGVVKDYHQNSLYDAIEPLMIVLTKGNNYVFVRTEEGDVGTLLAAVERAWKEVFPQSNFIYTFLDQDFNSQYKADEKRSQIFTAFSGLTVTIACLGLFGLARFTTEQRTKEIGVRKAFGAGTYNLVILVSREFFALVALGILIAFPASWYFTERWLQNFAYRIAQDGEWPSFLCSALIAFAITALTIGFHVARAGTSNLLRNLREG